MNIKADRLAILSNLLHELALCYDCGTTKRVQVILQMISDWSYAHRQGNGELSDEEQSELIHEHFKRIRDFVNEA